MNSTLCYIRNEKNEYLLIHRTRKENDLNEGKWIGVGGKFEEGETAQECVIREVREETGLTLTDFHLHGLVKFVSDTWEDEDMYLFSATGFTGELTDYCDEGELEWVSADKVLSLPTWEGDKYFLAPLLSGRKKIDMVVEYEGEKLVRHEDLTEDVRTLKSPLITCPHGFSTRRGGVSDGMFSTLNLGMNRGDERARVTENWNRFLDSAGIKNRSFVCGQQVHGNDVVIAGKKDLRAAYGKGEMNVCDGYVTAEPDVPLAIFTADCVPLLLEDPKAHVIGAVHCGWRSTAADIEKNAVDAMLSLGAGCGNIRAAIGPAIDKCCFEVGPEVIDAMRDLIGDDIGHFYEARSDKYMLDLRGAVKKRLMMLGLDPGNIGLVGECTMCHPEDYFSHRGTKGNRGSLASVICL